MKLFSLAWRGNKIFWRSSWNNCCYTITGD